MRMKSKLFPRCYSESDHDRRVAAPVECLAPSALVLLAPIEIPQSDKIPFRLNEPRVSECFETFFFFSLTRAIKSNQHTTLLASIKTSSIYGIIIYNYLIVMLLEGISESAMKKNDKKLHPVNVDLMNR